METIFFAINFIYYIGIYSYLTSEGAGIAEYLSLAFLVVATAGFFGFTFLKKNTIPKVLGTIFNCVHNL